MSNKIITSYLLLACVTVHASEHVRPQNALDRLIGTLTSVRGLLEVHFNPGTVEIYKSVNQRHREEGANHINGTICSYLGFQSVILNNSCRFPFDYYQSIEGKITHDSHQIVGSSRMSLGDISMRVWRNKLYIFNANGTEQAQLSLNAFDQQPLQVRASARSPWIVFFNKSDLYLAYRDACNPVGFDVHALVHKCDLPHGHAWSKMVTFKDVSLLQGAFDLVFSISHTGTNRRQECFYGIRNLLKYYCAQKSHLEYSFNGDLRAMEGYGRSTSARLVQWKCDEQSRIIKELARQRSCNNRVQSDLDNKNARENSRREDRQRELEALAHSKKKHEEFIGPIKQRIRELNDQHAQLNARKSLEEQQLKSLEGKQRDLKNDISSSLSEMGF